MQKPMTSHETTTHLAQSLRLQHLLWAALLILCPFQLLSGRVYGEEDAVDSYAPIRTRVKALKQRQPSGLGTIILRKASWQRLSPDPIRWPRAGEPLVLEPGHELLSNIEIGPGQCCVIRARLKQPRADRKVSWEPDAGDPAWGLRDRSGQQRLAFRIVGDQGYLDCRDLNSPRLAALPRPDAYTRKSPQMPQRPRLVGQPVVRFIDQPNGHQYDRSQTYHFSINSEDVWARCNGTPVPEHGWIVNRLVNPRGPMSVWIRSGEGVLVVDSVEIVDAATLKIDPPTENARKFQKRYQQIEAQVRKRRAEFDLNAVQEYRTTIQADAKEIVLTRQISQMHFDRRTCRIVKATVDGVAPQGLSLPDLVVVDERGIQYSQSRAVDGRLYTVDEKFEVILDGEFTPRSDTGEPFTCSYLVRYRIHKMNGLVVVETNPSKPVKIRRMTQRHELGRTKRGLDYFYFEGEPGPNPASLTWGYGWDVGNMDLSEDGPVSLYHNCDQPFNRNHFMTIHDGQLGIQFLSITWNHSKLAPSSLYRVADGGWIVPGESFRSNTWSSTPDTSTGTKCLVLKGNKAGTTAELEVTVSEEFVDVWARLRGSLKLTVHQKPWRVDGGDALSWRKVATLPGGDMKLRLEALGGDVVLDSVLFLPEKSRVPRGKQQLLLDESNYNQMTVTAEKGAAVVNLTFVNQPEAVTLLPRETFTYAFGLMPPKRWRPQHDNTTSLETMFQAKHKGKEKEEAHISWRDDLPEMSEMINRVTAEAGITLHAVNHGTLFGVGWPFGSPHILKRMIKDMRSQPSRTFGYTDVAVGQSGMIAEWGYYQHQEWRDEAPVQIPNWMSLASRTWRAHNLMRTTDIMEAGFDMIYYDSTNAQTTLWNRYGHTNVIGLQEFYEDVQLLLRSMDKKLALAIHVWGQMPLVNVGLGDMTMPGEQFWVGKSRSGYLEDEALKGTFNSYLAGCQVVGLMGASNVPFDDLLFYHQMLGYGYYCWASHYPRGITDKVSVVPAFTAQELKLYRQFHDPLVIFDTSDARVIDPRQPGYSDLVTSVSPGARVLMYQKPGKTAVIVTREKIDKSRAPIANVSLDLEGLGFGESVVLLDASYGAVEVSSRKLTHGDITLEKLDLKTPRQIFIMNRPERPSVLWRDLQTRVVLTEVFDESKKELRLKLRGVPNSRSRVVVWMGEGTQSVEVSYPQSGVVELSVAGK